MEELTFDGEAYVSSKRAAELTGYAKDYIGQMSREGRIKARLVGRNWYILKSGLEKHRFAAESAQKPKEKHFASEEWQNPRYQAEKASDLPPINKLSELENDALIEP